MTIILKNLVPVAYANNETKAKEMVIKKIFNTSLVKTWEQACCLSNCDQVYTFKNLTKEW